MEEIERIKKIQLKVKEIFKKINLPSPTEIVGKKFVCYYYDSIYGLITKNGTVKNFKCETYFNDGEIDDYFDLYLYVEIKDEGSGEIVLSYENRKGDWSLLRRKRSTVSAIIEF